MKIGICQINTTVGDFSGNLRRIEEGARKAHQRGAQLAVLKRNRQKHGKAMPSKWAMFVLSGDWR